MPDTTFTDAQKTDIRRYCGYPSMGALSGGQQSWRFFQTYGFMEFRISNSTAEEVAVVATTYLANLATLEAAIVSASDNLDTDRASVWYHNKQEIQHRERLFDDWRRRLCGFFGIPPGPALQPNSQMSVVV